MSHTTAVATVLAVLAGGLGSAARFVVDGFVRSRVVTGLPVGTTVVNVTGSFALGVVVGLVEESVGTDTLALVAGSGFLGGYTTFGTASFEVVRLLQQGRAAVAVLHLASMLGAGLVAAGAGLALVAVLVR